jgi:hypothetical protein
MLSGFDRDLKFRPRVLAMLEPWAEISERLRRFHPIQLTKSWYTPIPNDYT